MTKKYDSSSIKTLDILDAIRNTPGMYIGSVDADGVLVCAREVIDNSVDEFMNGHGKVIFVKVDPTTGVVSVTDQARGIPVGPHTDNPKISTLQATLTLAHTGGKFSKEYGVSGGLHGTGMKAVNALSSHLRATVWRDGGEHVLIFNNSVPTGPLQTTPLKGSAAKRTGTRIEFRLDPKYFPDAESAVPDRDALRTMLKERAYLNQGIRFEFTWGEEDVEIFYEEQGIAAYVEELAGDKRLFKKTAYFESAPDADIGVNVALTWTSSFGRDTVNGFCNCIRQPDGGTHIQGLRMSLPGIVRKYIEDNNILTAKEKDIKIEGTDCFEGVYAIVSIKHMKPVYKGQGKSFLSNSDAQGAVQRAVNAGLTAWFEENPKEARAVAKRAISAAKARIAASKAREQIRKQDAGSMGLRNFGKLKDCSSDDNTVTELFICEGDSAGGTVSMARDREFQAYYPLKGKPLAEFSGMMERSFMKTSLIAGKSC